MQRTGDLKLMQELNRYIILNTIREHGPISRSEIAKKINLSPTTVTSAVAELIKEGFVCEVGTGTSTGGRKPILLQFSPDSYFLIGVSITNSYLIIGEMNLEAKVQKKELFPIKGLTGDRLIHFVIDTIGQWLASYSTLSQCIGISVIFPGIVDSVCGVIRYNSKLKLKNIPLKEMIQKKYGLKTYLDNDTNAIALAEKKYGLFSQYKNIIYVTIGDGVGAGIVVNGSVLRGSHGGAGEFGHTVIERNGIPCDCGNRGCLENYISWPAIYSKMTKLIEGGETTALARFTDARPQRMTPADFRQALIEGDSLAHQLNDEVAEYLAVGLVNLVNLFNPNVILVGGEFGQNNVVLTDRVTELVAQRALRLLSDELKIRPTTLGDDFELMGAAVVLLQDVFRFSLNS